MTSGIRAVTVLFAPLVLLAAGCSDSPPPSVPSPFIAQVGGEWNGNARLVSVTGYQGSNAECVSEDIDARIRAATLSDERVTFSVAQNDKALQVELRSATTGLTCEHQGNAALSTFAVNGSCDLEDTPVFRCTTGGVQPLAVVGSVVNATVTNQTMTGTWTNSYNSPRGNVILTYQYSAQRQ